MLMLGNFLAVMIAAHLATTSLGANEEPALEIKLFKFKREVSPTLFLSQTLKGASPKIKFVKPDICPQGFTKLNNTHCVKWDPRGNMAKCDPGYVKDPVGRCSQYRDIACPEGHTKTDKNVCLKYYCADDDEMVDEACMKRCEGGKKRYYNNLCISTELVCPRGFRNKSGECILENCPSNMKTTDTECQDDCPFLFSKQGSRCFAYVKNCPTGYIRVDNNCLLDKCPSGRFKIGEGCVDASYVQCPEGYTPNENAMCIKCTKLVNNKCYEDKRTCPTDWYQLSNDKCVKICPINTAVLNNKCTSLKMDPCSKGTIFIQGKGCVKGDKCPAGYQTIGNTCVKLPSRECEAFTLNGKCIESCPEGYVEYNHECIRLQAGECPENFLRLAGTYCVKSCPEGFTAISNGCYPYPSCKGKKYFKGKCYDSCPSGSKQSEADENFCRYSFNCPESSYMSLEDQYERAGCPTLSNCKQYDLVIDEEFKLCRNKDSCEGTNYFFAEYCLSECPLGYQNLGRVCKKNSDTKCEKGVYHEGKCISNCPPGTAPQNGICIAAPPPEILIKCGLNQVGLPCGKDSTEECKAECVCKPGYIKVKDKQYCKPKPRPCPGNNTLDVLFIMDSSDYVNEDEFNLMKMFLMEGATHLFSVKPTMRIAVIIFGPKNLDIVYLGKITEECHCIDFFTTLERRGGNYTDLITALFVGRELVLSQCNGARIGVPRQIFAVVKKEAFLTSRVRKYIKEEVNKQEEYGHRLTFITIGEVKDLPPNVYVLSIDTITELNKHSSKMGDIACGELVCPKGYQIVEGKCVNYVECSGIDACHKSATCIDTPGSHYCMCPYGQKYVDDETGCAPKNETCKNKVIDPKEICKVVKCQGEMATCSAYNGEAFCVCPKGYTYDKQQGCIDVDECKNNPCLLKASCENLIGSFKCFCKEKGYYYHQHFGCIDVDECTTMTAPCSGNGKCTNTQGSYKCTCDAGYEYISEKGCKDIDECVVQKPCSGEKVECKNLPGTFECRCPPGYEYRDNGCRDIDECSMMGTEKACGKGVICTNTEPGYKCECQTGFVYNNKTRKCDVNTDSGLKQKRADLIFVVDSGSKMTKNVHGQVREMVSNIVADYHSKSSSVLQKVSSIVYGGNNEVKTIFVNAADEDAILRSRKLPYLGGFAKQSKALKLARETYLKHGQVNATRLVFLITASEMSKDKNEEVEIKKQVDLIKKEGRLIVIMIGQNLKRESWYRVFTKEEAEKYVLLVHVNMITTVHSLIYKTTDTLISCPHGFIFLDNVCQYKTKHTKYCIFDDQFYALNSSWTSNCILHRCTEEGVQMLDIKCLGIDGDCYEQGEPHPCQVKGDNYDYCTCSTKAQTTNIIAGKFENIINRVFIPGPFEQNITLVGEGSCIFPFKYKGHWFYTCTNDRSSYLWCAMDKYYQSRRYMKCLEEPRPCVVEGITHKHGDSWEKDCDTLFCKTGKVAITARCLGSDGKCHPVGSFFSCNYEGKFYKECTCLVSAYGYGWLKAIGRSSDKITNKTGEVVEFCEQGTTGDRHKLGSKWTHECYKLFCDNGETKIVEKNCMADDKSCHAIGSSGFQCTIRGKQHRNCTCEEHENNVVFVAYSEGKVVKEEKKTGSIWISSNKLN